MPNIISQKFTPSGVEVEFSHGRVITVAATTLKSLYDAQTTGSVEERKQNVLETLFELLDDPDQPMLDATRIEIDFDVTTGQPLRVEYRDLA